MRSSDVTNPGFSSALLGPAMLLCVLFVGCSGEPVPGGRSGDADRTADRSADNEPDMAARPRVEFEGGIDTDPELTLANELALDPDADLDIAVGEDAGLDRVPEDGSAAESTNTAPVAAQVSKPLDLTIDAERALEGHLWVEPLEPASSGFDAAPLFNPGNDKREPEVSVSVVPEFKGLEVSPEGITLPELDGGKVNFEVKTK